MDFILESGGIQRSHFTAIGLFDADGNFTAKLFTAELLHFPGFAQPAV